jgi:hypothetical protein
MSYEIPANFNENLFRPLINIIKEATNDSYPEETIIKVISYGTYEWFKLHELKKIVKKFIDEKNVNLGLGKNKPYLADDIRYIVKNFYNITSISRLGNPENSMNANDSKMYTAVIHSPTHLSSYTVKITLPNSQSNETQQTSRPQNTTSAISTVSAESTHDSNRNQNVRISSDNHIAQQSSKNSTVPASLPASNRTTSTTSNSHLFNKTPAVTSYFHSHSHGNSKLSTGNNKSSSQIMAGNISNTSSGSGIGSGFSRNSNSSLSLKPNTVITTQLLNTILNSSYKKKLYDELKQIPGLADYEILNELRFVIPNKSSTELAYSIMSNRFVRK